MSDELVRRLRESITDCETDEPLCFDARPDLYADDVREVIERIDVLEAANRGLVRLNEATEARAIAAEAALAASEAKVARLEEALKRIGAREVPKGPFDDARLEVRMAAFARAALASVQTGEKP